MNVALPPEIERMARRYAKNFSRRLPPHLDRDDFISVALLGAFRAWRDYDPQTGTKLSTYVAAQVRYALKDLLRQEDHLTRRQRAEVACGDVPSTYLPPVGLDEPLPQAFGEAQTPADLIAGPPLLDAEGMTAGLREAEARALLLFLQRRERVVIMAEFWGGESYAVIGKRLGVGPVRIEQLRARALKNLRAAVGGDR